MASDEQTFPFTSWEWRKVKIRRPPEAQKAAPRSGVHFRSRPRRDGRVPLTVTIKFRGGPECWYEVHARGAVGRYPGYLGIHDIMRDINDGNGGV